MALYDELVGELNNKKPNNSINIDKGSLYNNLLGELQAKYPNNSAAKLAEARAQKEAEEAKRKEEEERKKAEEAQKEEEIKKRIAEVSKAGVNTDNTLRRR